ncbi:restriction endonuclease [Pedobacter miscanthi]|uniref:nSTAND3 domain-containing NTPase n=1 Tax=Pedobacter miscanthi TaxID=2259170 RepID=UPI00292D06EA|nr:restriction endonuclease [Pedobacter miscanthi]
MNDYNFSTLNDKEFELLALDVLNKGFDLGLRSFKDGKDKGIDLRYASSDNNNKIVVQVKHYNHSKYAQLKFTLLHNELPKVLKLKPDRYIVVTSLPLTPGQADEIKELMSPFILTADDVIGHSTINDILRNYPEIEENHFKLWFSSTSVLKSILNNAVEGRTRAYVDKIQARIKYYVLTKKLDEAAEILDREKLLLISGQPGIGKSTLADVLFFARARAGYKIFKVYNIEEAERAISRDDEEKQLFYYDDFLGEIYYLVTTGSQHEAALAAFVDRIKATPNKYLVLTTRTVILSQAAQRSEKISNSDISGLQFELRLDDYSDYEKGQILYNHIYTRGLSGQAISAITTDKFYKKIIAHRNYTPRIIESITKPVTVNTLGLEAYRDFMLANLDNPEKIWSSSFFNQISYFDQRLLLTLFTRPYGMKDVHLRSAFESRLAYEKSENNQVIKANHYNDSIISLLKGFITSSFVKERVFMEEDIIVREFKLINPSLSDYLAAYLKDSYQEKKGVLASIVYLEQLKLFDVENSPLVLEKELQEILKDRIASGAVQSLDQYREYSSNGSILEVLCRHCRDISVDGLLLDYLRRIDFSSSVWWVRENLMYVLENIGDSPMTRAFIVENFFVIIEALIKSIDEQSLAKKIPVVFEIYGLDYQDYKSSDHGNGLVMGMLEGTSEKREKLSKMVWEDSVKDISMVNGIYSQLKEQHESLAKILLGSSEEYNNHKEPDLKFWEVKVQTNLARKNAELEQPGSALFKDPKLNPAQQVRAIDLLFSTAGWDLGVIGTGSEDGE